MRNLLHTLVSLLLWLLFGYYWYVVGQRRINPETVSAALILSTVVLAGLAVTVLWVAHNVRLARKFGRRKGFEPPPEPFTRDSLGRELVAPPLAELREAKVVSVGLDADGRKVYARTGEVAD